MHKLIGRWIPNVEYVGNNIGVPEWTIDEQIENLKIRHARRQADLEKDHQQRLYDLQEDYHREMAALMDKKAAVEARDAPPQ